jgi:tRNA 2-thiouridine synthesizing protein D
MSVKTLTFSIMDGPYEQGRIVTVLRMHGHDIEEEDHPLPKEWIAALMTTAEENGGKLDWINCGLCVDERGAHESIEGCRRGTPADLWKCATESDNTLIVGTR